MSQANVRDSRGDAISEREVRPPGTRQPGAAELDSQSLVMITKRDDKRRSGSATLALVLALVAAMQTTKAGIVFDETSKRASDSFLTSYCSIRRAVVFRGRQTGWLARLIIVESKSSPSSPRASKSSSLVPSIVGALLSPSPSAIR